MESEDKYIGRQIGNYRVVEALGGGSFGRIYLGEHIYLANRVVAIKLLHLTYLGSEQERTNFMQEAQFLEMLKHPNILPIYDVGIDDGFPYIVAEYASHGSLRDYLDERQPPIVPLHDVFAILTQVGHALQYVHEQNIVHRDLKPENILFNAKDQALLADFGIAVFLETTKTNYYNVMGSPLYMAPEQFDGLVSTKSDQYALACITYEMLTGNPPFMATQPLALGMMHQKEQPRPLREFNTNVPEHVEYAVLKALAKRREDRYPDIPSFLAALLTMQTGYLQLTKEQWLDEGNRLFNIPRYADALTAFERAIQLDTAFADAYEGKGSALYYLERPTESLAAYEQATQLDPGFANAHNGKGNVLYYLQRYHDALDSYEHAIQCDPDLADAYLGKGNVLYYLKQYDEALLAFENAIRLDPTNFTAFDSQSWTLRQLKRYEEALAASEQAMKLAPNNAAAYNGKARALFRLKRYEDSLFFFDRALQLDPKLATAYDFRGDTLYHMGHYEEALASYERAMQLDSHMASAHEGRGDVFCHFHRYAEALLDYDQAIRLNPNFGIFYYKKGEVLTHLGRLEEAQAAYEQARLSGYTVE